MRYVILMLLLLCSCTAERQLKKAINRYGQKESAVYLLTNYGEYIPKKDTTIYITINDTIMRVLPADTTIGRFDCNEDSFLLENEKLKLQLVRIGQSSQYEINTIIKADTIYKVFTDTIIVETKLGGKVEVSRDKWRNANSLLNKIIVLLIIVVIIYCYFKYIKK